MLHFQVYFQKHKHHCVQILYIQSHLAPHDGSASGTCLVEATVDDSWSPMKIGADDKSHCFILCKDSNLESHWDLGIFIDWSTVNLPQAEPYNQYSSTPAFSDLQTPKNNANMIDKHTSWFYLPMKQRVFHFGWEEWSMRTLKMQKLAMTWRFIG